jgi:hypothetical protein
VIRHPDWAPDATRARLALALGKADLAKEIEGAAAEVSSAEWRAYFRERGEYEKAHGDRASGAELQKRGTIPPGWNSLCGPMEICRRSWKEFEAPDFSLTLGPRQRDEVPPYAEIYLDDRRMAEAPIEAMQTFRLTGQNRTHRVEVRVANPLTRNLVPRIVSIVR